MIDISLNFVHNLCYLITDDSFQNSIQIIEQMPDFFGEKVQWGIDASYKTVGFMAVLVLGVSMFRPR